jgi:16S rRNA (cytidine1402-2'-O)-methyltransferase
MAKLILVPTPVGNLEDITLRALKTLEAVDFILAEDTRKSSILLQHYNIKKPLLPYHKFNEHKTLSKYIEKISSSKQVALVTDAGTPSISDPGYLLVKHCVETNIQVECLPGATALIPALAVAGFPSDRFCFEGFLPQKKGRNKRLNALIDEPRTIIFYESPYRIKKLIGELISVFGKDRKVSISREISKIHEETIRADLENLESKFRDITPKGEFVVVLEGKNLK